MPGRRKSIEQHQLDGTYRADRHGALTADDQPAAAPPPMPRGLKPNVAAKWAEAVTLLSGVVKPRDTALLVELASWLAESADLAEHRAGIKPGDKGYLQYMTARGITTDKLLQLSIRFGLSPSDRAKLRAEASAGPAKPKVATRPKTTLDAKGKAG